jgi:GNAT superfamily N-acetyltransferase
MRRSGSGSGAGCRPATGPAVIYGHAGVSEATDTTMLAVEVLDGVAIDQAATLVAREQVPARSHRPGLPVAYTDPERCRVALNELLADGYVGFVAHDERRCVGVMCGRTTDSVGFVPAHGLAVESDLDDSTAVVVGLLAQLASVLLRDGAVRFTIDHVDLHPLGAALNDAGFGRGSVFATQPAPTNEPAVDVDVRIGTTDDLDAIAALSLVEFAHRSTSPIYAHPQPRTLAETRALHERLLAEGAVHFLARRDSSDVGLITVEFTSPAPRLCPNAQPYIGPTASHPSVRGQGIGHALVHRVMEWAHVNGHETVSVGFDSSNPLSRPFWLGLGFEPTGYRVRRMIDPSYTVRGDKRE